MNVVRRKEQKERFVFVRFDKLLRLQNPLVSKVLITKSRRVATGVKPNPTDPVVDRTVVSVRPIHFECIAMALPGRVVLAGFLSAHPKWVRSFQIQNVMILHVDLRYTIVSRWQKKTGIEPNFQWPRFKCTVPVRSALVSGPEPQMPFADHRRLVTCSLQNRSDRLDPRLNNRRSRGGRDTGSFSSKRVVSGQKRVTGRSAGRSGAVATRKTTALIRQSVDVRRFQSGRAIA